MRRIAMNSPGVFPAAASLALLVTLSPCHLVTLSFAKELDLTRAIVVTPAGLSGPPAKAVRMLVEEVEQRSMVRWDRAEKWPAGGTPVIVVGPAGGVRDLLDRRAGLRQRPEARLPAAARARPEGYRIGVASPVAL